MFWGINSGEERIEHTREMKNDQNLICRLSPFIGVNLQKPFSEVTACTDASLNGGVAYKKGVPEFTRRVGGVFLLDHQSRIKSVFDRNSEQIKRKKMIHLLKFPGPHTPIIRQNVPSACVVANMECQKPSCACAAVSEAVIVVDLVTQLIILDLRVRLVLQT